MKSPAPPRSSQDAGVDRLALRAVVAVWAVATVAAFWFVATHVFDVPWADEYDIVAVATGNAPFSPSWLWEPHNEHRIPLPRLVRYGLLELTGNDFRAGPVAITAILSGLGLATALVAGRVRRRLLITDAFFPLVWLHWGQVDNMIWGFQLQFALSVLLTTVALLIIVARGREPGPGPVLLIGGCSLLLPLCGSNGALTAAPLAAWLGFAGLARWARGSGRLVAVAMSFGVFLLIAVYFRGLPLGKPLPPEVTWWNQAEVALAFLSSGFGLELDGYWRTGGLLLAGLLVAAGAIAIRAAGAQPAERARACGLVAIAASAFLLAAGVGHGRAAWGIEGGLQSRYATLLIPALCAVYFAADLYLPDRFGLRARVALLIVAVAMQANADNGLSWARRYAQRRAEFLNDLDSGWPSALLAANYYHHPFGMLPHDPAPLERYFLMLHDAGVGPFTRMSVEPCVPVRLTRENSKPVPGGVRLVPPRRVYAVQLIWGVAGTNTPQPMKFRWRGQRPDGGGSVEQEVVFELPTGGELIETYVWVDTVLDEFRFPANPRVGRLTIGKLTLMAAPDRPSPAR